MKKKTKTRKKLLHKKKVKKTVISSIKDKPGSRLKIFGITLWKVIVGFLLIIGGIASYEPVMNLFKSPKEKYNDDNFIEGDLKPDKSSKTSELKPNKSSTPWSVSSPTSLKIHSASK